jgi:hypothetical protein
VGAAASDDGSDEDGGVWVSIGAPSEVEAVGAHADQIYKFDNPLAYRNWKAKQLRAAGGSSTSDSVDDDGDDVHELTGETGDFAKQAYSSFVSHVQSRQDRATKESIDETTAVEDAALESHSSRVAVNIKRIDTTKDVQEQKQKRSESRLRARSSAASSKPKSKAKAAASRIETIRLVCTRPAVPAARAGRRGSAAAAAGAPKSAAATRRARAARAAANPALLVGKNVRLPWAENTPSSSASAPVLYEGVVERLTASSSSSSSRGAVSAAIESGWHSLAHRE